ncbi:MAG: rod shape-determining protein MreC [Eubacteriales bacterium]|nr:rod shape-determining protein MreC [Eubacteriales bacterium]
MNQLFNRKTIGILAIITIILLLMTAFLRTGRSDSSFLETGIETILSPFQKVISIVDGGVNEFFGYFGSVKRLKETNEALTKRIAQLENENRTLTGYKTENERLKGLLSLDSSLAYYETVGCRVIAKDSGNWFDTFTIDKGRNAGIKINQNVITNGGLVGRISKVGSNWSKVATIIDETSSLGCIITRTGDIAVIEGDLELSGKGLCKLSYMSSSSAAAVGDSVESSGLGGVFRKGLMIGKIKEIHTDTQGLTQYAVIEPSVDFGKITEVLVITN